MPSDIETLRAAAKRLKKACDAGDTAAIDRVRHHLAGPRPPRLADCLHAIARENGHESWPKLKFAHEAAALTREQRAERLRVALFQGQNWVVERLLSDDPGLKDHDIGLQIALYDLAAVKAAIERSPAAATRAIGARRPMLHLAFSRYIHMAPERQADMLALARLLHAHGADVNDGYSPEPGSDHRLSALYGALGHADNMPLAEWLLEQGATPDDNESLYHATELGHHDGLRLLLRHGATSHGTNALPRALDFDDVEAVRLLLEHGADPNEGVAGHPGGQPSMVIPALHQAARRWCSAEIAELLLQHGADPDALWHGRAPYAIARIFGNGPVAELLERRGHAGPLSDAEAALADIAAGKAGVTLDRTAVRAEDRQLATLLTYEPSRLDHLKGLIEAGFDPNWTDPMKVTPLQGAAWSGLPDHVALLLQREPDLERRNAYGGNAIGTCLHGAEHCPDAASRDHVACARLLLEAGARIGEREIDACGSEEMVLFLEDWRNAAA